ncbi:hypothetical protein ACIBEJ_08520 [Nonomuraea sp. NPDC050790]
MRSARSSPPTGWAVRVIGLDRWTPPQRPEEVAALLEQHRRRDPA